MGRLSGLVLPGPKARLPRSTVGCRCPVRAREPRLHCGKLPNRQFPATFPAVLEISRALSFALDLTEDAVPGHAVRSCLIGMRIGRELGLDEAATARSLLRPAAQRRRLQQQFAARMCQILGGDDRAAKRRVKTVDWTRVSLDGLKLAWVNSLPEAASCKKALRVVELGLGRERNNAEDDRHPLRTGRGYCAQDRPERGCADAIYSLDEHWNGSGYPDRLKGRAAIAAPGPHSGHRAAPGRLRLRTEPRTALATMVERSGSWFDPELVKDRRVALPIRRTLDRVQHPAGTRYLVVAMEPGATTILGAEQVDRVCEAFADVVDAKSPFTYRHSIGVTEAAVGLAEQFGFSPERPAAHPSRRPAA
jgi:hypothetical protein